MLIFLAYILNYLPFSCAQYEGVPFRFKDAFMDAIWVRYRNLVNRLAYE